MLRLDEEIGGEWWLEGESTSEDNSSRKVNLSPEGRKKIRYGTRGLSMLPKEISRV